MSNSVVDLGCEHCGKKQDLNCCEARRAAFDAQHPHSGFQTTMQQSDIVLVPDAKHECLVSFSHATGVNIQVPIKFLEYAVSRWELMRKKAADRTAEQGQLHPDFHGMFLSRSKPRCPVCDFGMVAGIHTGDWHCGGCRRIIDDKLMVYSRNPDAPGLDKFLEDYKKAKWGLRDAEIKGAVPNVATTKKETQTIGQGYKRRCLDHNNPAKEADAINKLAALGCAKCYTVMTVQGDVAKCLNCGEEKRA